MSTNKPKCYAPFYNVYLRASSKESKVCCMSTQSHTLESNAMSEVFNNPLAQDVRSSMIKGDWHSVCSECEQREASNLRSDRLMYNEWYEEAVKHSTLAPISTLMPEPIWADIRPSNLCNLKCRMCFPDNSTEIAREEAQMPKHLRPNRNTDKQLAVWSQRKQYELPELNNIVNLKLLGGEPTVQQEVFDILEKLTYNENSLVHITTNASNITQYKKIMPLLNRFAQVCWSISIDGYRAGYEYVRTPARWDKFSEAVNYLTTTPAGRLNTIVSFNVCVQAWNFSNIPETLEYITSIKDRLEAYSNIHYGSTHLGLVSQPHLSLQVVPDLIKSFIIEYAHTKNINKELLTEFISLTHSQNYCEELVEEFLQHTETLDKVRNTGFDTVDPALVLRLRTVTS